MTGSVIEGRIGARSLLVSPCDHDGDPDTDPVALIVGGYRPVFRIPDGWATATAAWWPERPGGVIWARR